MGNAEDIRTLAQDIAGSYDARVKAYDARVKEIGGIKKETDRLLKDFRTAHKEMADTLSDTLAKSKEAIAKGEKVRLAEFKPMIQGIRDRIDETKDRVGEIKDEAHKLLTDFSKSHAEMSSKLRASLSKEVKIIKKDTADLLRGFHTANEALAKEWKNLTVLMEKKRAGKEIRPKVVEAKPKVAKPLVVKPPLKEVPVVESLEAKVLGIIKETPGISLSEIGEVLGIHFVRVGGIAKTLVEQGKVRKEEKNYYPVG